MAHTTLPDTSETSAGASPAPSPSGRTRLGRYFILSLVGSGGMGTVYAAYDPTLDRRVALKLLRRDRQTGQSRERLVREAKFLARLAHPNVVTVYEVGDVDGETYVAMEFVEGQDLASWLAEPRSVDEILDKFRGAGEGLWAAHEAGLIHRDFKPANVLLGKDGRPRVTDFGISYSVSLAPDDGHAIPVVAGSKLTRPGAIVGTPAYMAPEQREGKEAFAAADQYSFAASLHEALLGYLPGEQPDATAGVAKVPPHVRAALARALQPDARDRYPTLRELLDALAPKRRRARAWLIGGAFGAAAIAASVLVIAPSLSQEDPCEGLARAADSIWNPEVRELLRRAFVASGHPQGAALADRVASTIDAYTGRWIAARRDACEATHRRGEQSLALLDRRSACFDSLGRELGAALRQWTAKPNRTQVAEAAEAVASLDTMDRCSVANVLATPVTDVRHLSLRIRLDELNGAILAGKLAEIGDEAAALAAEARGMGSVALEGEALLTQAMSAFARRDKIAEPLLHETLERAGKAHHDRLLAEATLQLIPVQGDLLGRQDEALRTARLAGALVERAGADPALLANLRQLEGGALADLDRLDEAIVKYREALALVRKYESGRLDRLGRILHDLGSALQFDGHLEEALAMLEEAHRVFEQAHGPSASSLRINRNSMAIVYSKLGDRERASAIWRELAEHEVAAVGNTSPALVSYYANLSFVALEADRLDEAAKFAHEVLRVLTANGVPEHPTSALMHINLAEVSVRRGDASAALHHVTEGERRFRAATEEPVIELSQLAALRGDALALQRKPAEARTAYERALALFAKAEDPDPGWRAAPLFGIARLEWDAGRKQSARDLAREAFGLVDDESDFQALRAAIARWQTAHP